MKTKIMNCSDGPELNQLIQQLYPQKVHVITFEKKDGWIVGKLNDDNENRYEFTLMLDKDILMEVDSMRCFFSDKGVSFYTLV